jgi:F-box protein 18 (helicase)
MPENNQPRQSSDIKDKLTDQQIAIINSQGDIKINAVAGSGKTTTIVEYAASKPKSANILYLAFNKSVKLEAVRKFFEKGLNNVKVETAHSLAYKHIVYRYSYKVKPQSYKTYEIADLLGLQGNGEKHAEFVIANHINKFVSYFCNSDKLKVQDLNYLDTVTDSKATAFVQRFHRQIEEGTRVLLAKMERGEIEITHDFYLKKFQLSNPVLHYDYILFDEGQDASAAMVDVFLKQKAIKLIVGDTHQQIYGWRFAINSLEKTDFNTLHLSASFRFDQSIANLAMEVLKWKNHLFEYKQLSIIGKGTGQKEVSKATIGRTNLGLLVSAINYITDNRNVKHIYFEGNINSYTYADDGASLYDVLNLYNSRNDLIRDKLIQSMNTLDDLEEYIKKTEDVQLAMMVDLVMEYDNEIPGIIKNLKDLHIGDDERTKAEMIFSTVHRAKGMEYDVVHLVDDFITEAKLEKPNSSKEEGLLDKAKLNEEINLLYVAITRTKNKLHIPETLVPKGFPASKNIHIVKTQDIESLKDLFKEDDKSPDTKQPAHNKKINHKEAKEKTYSVAAKREVNKDAYKPWTPELDKELKELYDDNASVSRMAEHFGRTKGAILSRLKKLNYFAD